MTDEEIIKALEVCGKDQHCTYCPLYKVQKEDGLGCIRNLKIYALDLINRQQAEIEDARIGVESFKLKYSNAVMTAKELQLVIAEKQAEIEGLQKAIEVLEIMTDQHDYYLRKAKSEAIKEFTERFENKINEIDFPKYAVVEKMLVICKKIMNDTVKEMVGEQE